jgi:hypothetical protein
MISISDDVKIKKEYYQANSLCGVTDVPTSVEKIELSDGELKDILIWVKKNKPLLFQEIVNLDLTKKPKGE